MNRSLFLQLVERLEGLVHKLPGTIQKPILSELTPLKELFLQQRPPRFLLTGPDQTPLPQVVSTLFPGFTALESESAAKVWQDFSGSERGTISVLDGRESSLGAGADVEDELKKQPADIVLFLDEADDRKKIRKNSIEHLAAALSWNDGTRAHTNLIGIVLGPAQAAGKGGEDSVSEIADRASRLQNALESKLESNNRLLRVFTIQRGHPGEAKEMMSLIARQLPNEARIEMVRISGDRQAQREIAQLLVKSTSAVCTAIGAQPIPLADLPILTALQLMMVSGIMYVSGRERSMKAAAEFIAALGANVGAGMLLREGTRAVLKFFPGWGNLVCGMVAGAGTYAMGRAAIVFFLEGVSLKDARRTYLASRKRPPKPALPAAKGADRRQSEKKPTRTRRLRLGG